MLSAIVSASAQITQNRKYDWGWSYKLEMPETGLKCEFPAKPKNVQLAYGYMTLAAHNDELFIAAKLENPEANDVVCRTEEFTSELKKVYGLPIDGMEWSAIKEENGNLTVSANTKGGYAKFHIDAIATEDVLTIFIYSHHDELSVPGHFFANSYSVNDAKAGGQSYMKMETTRKRAKVLEYDNGRSLVRLENCPVTTEWPEIPSLEVNRNVALYNLEKDGSRYATTVVEVGPEVSYAYFNTFISRENLKMGAAAQLVDDRTDIAYALEPSKEAFFRKLTYKTDAGTIQRYYVAAGNHIIVQELTTKETLSKADSRFLQSFEHSVKNHYDTKVLVSK